jgi:LEA14-like dessication related protein
MKKAIIWGGAIILLVGVVFIGGKLAFKPVKFGEIKTVKALNMNLQDLRMELTFEVENPNFFPVTVVDFEFDVWLNNSYIGVVHPVKTFVLPAHTKGLAKIPVSAEYKGNIFEGFLMALETFDKTETKYKAEGAVKVKALYINKEISIKKSGVAKMVQAGDTLNIP